MGLDPLKKDVSTFEYDDPLDYDWYICLSGCELKDSSYGLYSLLPLKFLMYLYWIIGIQEYNQSFKQRYVKIPFLENL